ncbi:hypothetical protein [Numidum massiliense]|uniref:hypothetical protein n=1 Tax=Numidum massiliense TaxID=1522315 RepID=UPI0006D583FC|nr:hypothetical protein [Numidum massiliense]
MARPKFHVVQHAYVGTHGKTYVLTVVESGGKTFRHTEEHEPYPLYDCALDCWQLTRDWLLDEFNARQITLNCNVLGQIEVDADGNERTIDQTGALAFAEELRQGAKEARENGGE